MGGTEELARVVSGIEAARTGDVEGMRSWLDAGNDPNAYDATGWTPLLVATGRSNVDVVGLLLSHAVRPADPRVGHRQSGMLPIHVAAQAGDIPCTELLLAAAPDTIDAVYDINGHSPLLQAVFYGHLPLARELLRRGADTAITTARGLGPRELAEQFQNQPMVDALLPYDKPAAQKAAYYEGYLRRIAPVIPDEERGEQERTDRLVAAIAEGIARGIDDPASTEQSLAEVRRCLAEVADVNRLGGPLLQPPLVVAVTGNNGLPGVPEVARLRLDIARLLIDRGADPSCREHHPMGAQTVIRAAVFNHLDILRLCSECMTAQAFADAINEYPLVNGLTAMHDTVLRATMAAPDRFDGYVEQARFFVEHGGRVDIEDFAGVTQRDIADRCEKPIVRARLLAVLDRTEQPTSDERSSS